MENDRHFKIIAIIGLVAAVAGIGVGFAAFAKNLVIGDVQANVTGDSSQFTIGFGESAGALSTNTTINGTAGTGSSTGTAGTLKIEADSAVITQVRATLVNPGDSVSFKFYVVNTSPYDAYLNKIDFSDLATDFATTHCAAADVDGDGTGTAATAATAATAEAICTNDLHISITVNGTTASDFTDVDGISSNVIAKRTSAGVISSKEVNLVISYDTEANGATYADGGVTADFGDITLTYSTAD